MQRNSDNKYDPEDNAFVGNPASANVIENLNATSSHSNQTPAAKAMRSGHQHEVAYEVAGPTVGGMAPYFTTYNADSITDSMSKTKISEGTSATTPTTTSKPVGASMTDSVSNAGARAAGAVGAVAAGATTAGSNLVSAAQNLASHHDAPDDSMESPHPHPIAYMSGMPTQIQSRTTTTSTSNSAPKSAHVEPILSTGLNTPVTPTHSTHHHHTTHHVPKGEVAIAGVIGAASATLAAPPVNDTIRATRDFTPSESSSRASSHPAPHSSPSEGLAKMTSTSTTSSLTPAEEKHLHEHLHEHRSSIKDKVRNVFHRRPSAQTAAEAEAAAAAAAEAAKLKGYDAKVDRFEAVPETPYTSSGAPKADLHAAPGKPAVKLDAHPTTTLNQGHIKTTTMEPSRPLTEKITAPAVGAAATFGAAATGTAAYLDSKAKDAKGAVVDTTNNLTYSNNPTAHTTTYSTPSVSTYNAPNTMERTTFTTSQPSRPLTEKITAPVIGAASAVGATAVGTAANVGSKAQDAKGAVMDSTNKLSHGTQQTSTTSYSTPSKTTLAYTTPAVDTTAAYSTPAFEKTTGTTTGPSLPLTDKITTPVVAAAAAAGTAAYMGSKPKDAKEAVTGTTLGSAYNSSSYPTTTTTTTKPAVSSYSTNTPVNTSSSYTTATSGTPAPATTTSSSGATPVHIQTADKIAAAIPASYKGPIPKAGPGEEVVWVKTTTTTAYYDSDKGLDTNGDVVETHQNVLDPNSFQTEHDNVTTYVSDGHGGKRPVKNNEEIGEFI